MRRCTLPHHATIITAPRWLRIWLGLALITIVAGCGDHAEAEGESPATSSSDRKPKADSAAGAASVTRLGGGAGSNSAGETEDYTAMTCSDAQPPANTTDYPECDGSIQCPQGRCIPTNVIATTIPGIVGLLPACSSGRCVPMPLRGVDVRFKPCSGLLGDGRCVPECIAASAMPLGTLIFQPGEAGCGRAEVCVPCEVAGTTTGICEFDECAG